MNEYIQKLLLACSLVASIATVVFIALSTQDDRRCRDALLRDNPAASYADEIECDHEQHTLVRDGDRFRCVCPNTRLEEPTR